MLRSGWAVACASIPLQLFSRVFPVQKRGGKWNHVFGDLRKEYLNGFWGAIGSFLRNKDCFHTGILLFHFSQFFEGSNCNGLQAIHTFRVSLVFASISMSPWNNPGNSIKEMALAGWPEPYGQRKCFGLGSQSLAGLPSDRLPHRELPDLCAEHV